VYHDFFVERRADLDYFVLFSFQLFIFKRDKNHHAVRLSYGHGFRITALDSTKSARRGYAVVSMSGIENSGADR